MTYQTFRPRLGKLPKTAAKPALSAAYVNNFRQSEEIQVSPRKRDYCGQRTLSYCVGCGNLGKTHAKFEDLISF
jgi:hypothetical protein